MPRARGRVRPRNLQHLQHLSHRAHGDMLLRLPVVTPAAFDCRAMGWVGPVKDQGQCGSCWDFSGTGVVEGAYNKAGIGGGADVFILSEEYTLDCGQNGGCNGDDNTTVLQWAQATGLPLTSAYGPYTAGGACAYKSAMQLYKIASWGFADSAGGQGVTSTLDIKQAMMAFGPVGCGIAADDAFEAWGDNNPAMATPFPGSGNTSIDHDVILVGWDDATGSWILRNSWGTSWGCCLAGDTRISLVSGVEATIEDLSRWPAKFWVYAYDQCRDKIVPARATAKQTGHRSDLVRVTLDNGESVLCTGDHPWMMRDGTFRHADKLRPDDSLMPLYRSHKKGYEKVLQPDGRWDVTHWRVVHELDIRRDGESSHACDNPKCKLVVHHGDFNGLNNDPDNLEVMFECEHAELHRLIGKKGSEALRAWWADPVNRAIGEERSIRSISEYNEKVKAGEIELTDRQIDARRKNALVAQAVSAERMRREGPTEAQMAAAIATGKARAGARQSEESKQKRSDTMLERYGVEHGGQLPVTEAQREARRRNMTLLNKARSGNGILNHKVVSIEAVNLAIPVYDLVVEDHHNFATSAGTFVHNSGYMSIAYGANLVGSEAVFAMVKAPAPAPTPTPTPPVPTPTPTPTPPAPSKGFTGTVTATVVDGLITSGTVK